MNTNDSQNEYSFPLTLLQNPNDCENQVSQHEIAEKEGIIRTTLKGYGINIESIKAKPGPSFTFFKVKLSPLTRMSVISDLANDPPLEFASRDARINIQVEEKTICIEMPNEHQRTVFLKDALQSMPAVAPSGILPCVIGESVDGHFFFDLAQAHHVLVAGATGGGKSVCLHSIILSLLYSKHPDELQFVFIDPKKVELGAYNRIGNYLAELKNTQGKVVLDTHEAMAVLDALDAELDNRFRLLHETHAKNIDEYNNQPGHGHLPFIVVVIDEFADLAIFEGEAFDSKIRVLSSIAHQVGIHFVLSTQRPTVNIITGFIKANFPTRIAFRVADEWDSYTILDRKGASQLHCVGDMLFSEGESLIRLRGTFVSDEEIKAVTEYISNHENE